MRLSLVFIFAFLILASCGRDNSYKLVKAEADLVCDCKSVKQSHKWFKKRFKANKYFKKQDSLYIPRDLISGELHDYQDIRVLADCADSPFTAITVMDSLATPYELHYYFIDKANYQSFKKYKCRP